MSSREQLRYGPLLYSVLALLCCCFSLQASVSEADLKMCSSLDVFINNTNRAAAQCERDTNCTVVTCTVSDAQISQIIRNSQTKFLPCLTPPAISLLFLRPNGSVFSSHLVKESMEVPILSTPYTADSFDTFLHLSLQVNISHASPDYLQVETDLILRIEGAPQPTVQPLNELTFIMLDSAMCQGEEPSLITPTSEFTSSRIDTTTGCGSNLDQSEAACGTSAVSGSTILIFSFLLLAYCVLR